jgi:hypothetical protein
MNKVLITSLQNKLAKAASCSLEAALLLIDLLALDKTTNIAYVSIVAWAILLTTNCSSKNYFRNHSFKLLFYHKKLPVIFFPYLIKTRSIASPNSTTETEANLAELAN